jgi:hypothetical protein
MSPPWLPKRVHRSGTPTYLIVQVDSRKELRFAVVILADEQLPLRQPGIRLNNFANSAFHPKPERQIALLRAIPTQTTLLAWPGSPFITVLYQVFHEW